MLLKDSPLLLGLAVPPILYLERWPVKSDFCRLILGCDFSRSIRGALLPPVVPADRSVEFVEFLRFNFEEQGSSIVRDLCIVGRGIFEGLPITVASFFRRGAGMFIEEVDEDGRSVCVDMSVHDLWC